MNARSRLLDELRILELEQAGLGIDRMTSQRFQRIRDLADNICIDAFMDGVAKAAREVHIAMTEGRVRTSRDLIDENQIQWPKP